MKKTAILSDAAFLFLATSLPVVCLLRYYRYSLAVATIAGGLLAVAVVALFLAFTKRKNGKFVLKKREETLLEETLFSLTLLPKKQLAEIFLAAYLKKDENACLKRYGNIYAVSAENYTCFPLVSAEEIGSEQLLSIYRIHTAKEKKLLVSGLSERAAALATRLNLTVCSREEIYALLKETQTLPTPQTAPSAPYKKYRLFFLKKNAKKLCFGGVTVLLASFFVPFPYYYLVFGGFMMIAALALRLFGKEAG